MSVRVHGALSQLRERIGRLSVVYAGNPIAEDDANLVRFALCARTALLYDLLSPDHVSLAVNRAYTAVCNLQQIDVSLLGKEIKQVGLALRRYANEYSGEVETLSDFTHRTAPRCKGLLLSPVYPTLEDFLRRPSPSGLAALVQFVDFMSKLNMRSVSYESEMVAEYDAQESAMQEWTYADGDIRPLRYIWQNWLKDYVPDFSTAHHGSGATAELTRDRGGLLAKVSLEHCDFGLWRYAVDHGLSPEALFPDGNPVTTSELQFVPKSMTTNRVISKEPTVLQFLQQGLKDTLYAYFKHHPFLRKVVDLERQELSQGMARIGSRTGSYVTYDLSAASDSVSFDLVYELSAGTKLQEALVRTRSAATHHHGSSWVLKKFAPMGSAVCFPVEVLVFCSICELARKIKKSGRLYRVYGDDLIVPSEYADLVQFILERLHFTVNERKSFKGGSVLRFREACGGEYCNGADVTPVRMSRQFRLIPEPTGKIVSDAAAVQSWIGLSNQLLRRGLLTCRAYVLREMQLALGDLYKAIPRHGEGGIITPNFTEQRQTRISRMSHPKFLSDKIHSGAPELEYLTLAPTIAPHEVQKSARKVQKLNSIADLELARYYAWWERRRDGGSIDLPPVLSGLSGQFCPDPVLLSSLVPTHQRMQLRWCTDKE